MKNWNFNIIKNLHSKYKNKILTEINSILEKKTAEERILWGLQNLPSKIILTSSFGLQSIVSLHLMITIYPKIKIIFIDTGYLFPETYKFINNITKIFSLNLTIIRSIKSPAWQESTYGKLWKKGISGIEKYNQINKIQPLQKYIKKTYIQTWFSGLRRIQSKSRKNLPVLLIYNNIYKIFPFVDWSNKEILNYIQKNKLPHHPLWNQGYKSLGDIHTTQKFKDGMKEEDTRFFGLQRECGIHKQ